jgi:hypothetical protein
MSSRLRFTSIDMHLLGWVGGRYGCHGGSLVRITVRLWRGIRTFLCTRLHRSGSCIFASRHNQKFTVWWFLHLNQEAMKISTNVELLNNSRQQAFFRAFQTARRAEGTEPGKLYNL